MLKFIPQLFFAASLLIIGGAYGLISATTGIFPAAQVNAAIVTAKSLVEKFTAPTYFGEVVGVSEHDLPITERLVATGQPNARSFLVAGGLNQFLNICPEQGCLAVTINARGDILDFWPYKPEEIYAAPALQNAYEHLGFSPLENTRPIGVTPYDNGDLLVTFQAHGPVFPYGTGVGRIDKSGNPVWFRMDYSHHWAHLNQDGTAWVPTLTLDDRSPAVRAMTNLTGLTCATNKQMIDHVQLLDPNGATLTSIDLLDAMLMSPFAQFVGETSDACDWLHLNFIDVFDRDIPGIAAKGDLLLSFRNLSALAILDPDTKQIRHLQRGNFLQQHSANIGENGKIILFDNWGGTTGQRTELGMPAQIIELDLQTAKERTIFPSAATPDQFASIMSNRAGHIDLSPDGQRAVVSFSESGKALEINLLSGDIVSTYDHLHDLSALDAATENAKNWAIRYQLFSMLYYDQTE